MKYVSEITNEMYNTEKECVAAEKAFLDKQAKAKAEKEKKANERANRAKEVETAYKAAVEANKHYKTVLDAFLKDYGSFHMTYTDSNDFVNDIVESVFKFF